MSTTRKVPSLITLLRDVLAEDDALWYEFMVSDASALEIERRMRDQVIEELALDREERIKRLLTELEQVSTYDTEASHSMADDLLIAFIDDERVTACWEKMDRWYA